MMQKTPSENHRTTLSGYIFATKARIDNHKKLVEQQYLPYMSSQYGELWPLTAEIRWEFGAPHQIWKGFTSFNEAHS